MFLMDLLMGGTMGFKAGRIFTICYFQCILQRKVSMSGNILFRAYKVMLEIFVRGEWLSLIHIYAGLLVCIIVFVSL